MGRALVKSIVLRTRVDGYRFAQPYGLGRYAQVMG
jgi:hypothetical protein